MTRMKIEAPEPPSSPKPKKGLFARLFRTRAEVPSPEFPPLPPELERLAKRVGRIGVYGEGIDAALRSFDVMRRDDVRLAGWYSWCSLVHETRCSSDWNCCVPPFAMSGASAPGCVEKR